MPHLTDAGVCVKGAPTWTFLLWKNSFFNDIQIVWDAAVDQFKGVTVLMQKMSMPMIWVNLNISQ